MAEGVPGCKKSSEFEMGIFSLVVCVQSSTCMTNCTDVRVVLMRTGYTTTQIPKRSQTRSHGDSCAPFRLAPFFIYTVSMPAMITKMLSCTTTAFTL